MARAATTTDAFNAVAEPRRRQILDVIADGELSVTELVSRLAIAQPLVSKHLRVLRETGLVTARDDGRQRLYQLNGDGLRPIYDWVKDFEQLWSERFARLDDVLAELAADKPSPATPDDRGRITGDDGPGGGTHQATQEDDDDNHE